MRSIRPENSSPSRFLTDRSNCGLRLLSKRIPTIFLTVFAAKGFKSLYRKWRSCLIASIIVVPLPPKGSNTISPGFVNKAIRNLRKSCRIPRDRVYIQWKSQAIVVRKVPVDLIQSLYQVLHFRYSRTVKSQSFLVRFFLIMITGHPFG